MNPLTDELSDDVKAELAAMFAYLRRQLLPVDPEFQRAVNRAWNNPATRCRPWTASGQRR